LESLDSHDLNFSNRLVRTRMSGGVAGAQLSAAPYAVQFLQDGNLVFVAGLARLKQGGLCLDGQHEIDDILLLVRRQTHLGL
jgi:hypothetical protein